MVLPRWQDISYNKKTKTLAQLYIVGKIQWLQNCTFIQNSKLWDAPFKFRIPRFFLNFRDHSSHLNWSMRLVWDLWMLFNIILSWYYHYKYLLNTQFESTENKIVHFVQLFYYNCLQFIVEINLIKNYTNKVTWWKI